MEPARLKAEHAAARVGEREDEPALEVVAAAPARQAGGLELLGRVSLLAGLAGEGRSADREPEPELAADLLVAARGRRDSRARSSRPANPTGSARRSSLRRRGARAGACAGYAARPRRGSSPRTRSGSGTDRRATPPPRRSRGSGCPGRTRSCRRPCGSRGSSRASSTGLTEKLGVFSSWNGQRPASRAPALRSGVRSSTTATKSAFWRTASTLVSLIRAIYRRGSVFEGVAVGHPGDELGDLVGFLTAVGERVEDPADGRAGALVLDRRHRAQVDALEHEGAEREHRAADLVALADVALSGRGLDQVVDERVDALRPGRAEHLDLIARQIGLLEDAVADRVVDVVVDVGDAVDDPDDLALEGLGLLLAGVGEDAVPDLVREIERLGDP